MYCYLVLVLVLVSALLVLVLTVSVLVLVLVLTLLVLALVSVSELPVLTTRLLSTLYFIVLLNHCTASAFCSAHCKTDLSKNER